MATNSYHGLSRLRFQDMELVRSLAVTGSLRRTAAALGISQPLVSRRLREIEHTLGVTLWGRSTKGVSWTAAGERFLTWAETLLNELDEAHSDVRASPAPPLRLGAQADLVLVLMPRVLSMLPSPQRATIAEGLLPELLAGLRRGELDAVVANCPPDSVADDAFGLEPLFRQRLIIVAGPTFAIASSWAALSRAPWIIPPTPGGPLRRAIDARFVAAGLAPPKSAFDVPNMVAALQMVSVGLGLSAVPEIVMSAAAIVGQVKRIAIKPAIELPPTCLLYRRAAAHHPRTRAIADAVRTAANDMIAGDKSLRRLS